MFAKIRWGIHPVYNKQFTEHKPIEKAPLPKKVIIPVRQHIGAPCVPLVKLGDVVKKGTLIASNETASMSSNIHASVSGKVTGIGVRPHPVYGQCLAIEIESDGFDEWEEGVLKKRDYKSLSPSEMLSIIKDAGIVGMGGAAFPTYVKLASHSPVDTLIINGAECEPYLTVDHRVMLEYTKRVMTGIQILKRILNVKDTVVGIESNKPDAIGAMKREASGLGIRVVALPTKYPQGAEKMLISTLLGRRVPSGHLPMDVGVVVQNVSTTVTVCDAVTAGIPLIERVVTVSGDAVKEPKNLLLRIGTSFANAIGCCGGFSCTPEKLLSGGPMMGAAQYTADVPVVKGTSGILALSRKCENGGTENPCIRCGRCVANCPMGLSPGMLSILAEHGKFDEARERYHLFDCMECGCCSFGCPAKRNIVHYIKYAKKICAGKLVAKKVGSKK